MRHVVKWITFVLTLAAAGWAFCDIKQSGFEWDSLTAFLAALATFLGLEVTEVRSTAGNPNDIALYKKLVVLIPPPTIGAFYRTHDFGADFQPEYADALHRFAQDWNSPDHEFVDKKLEKERKLLYEKGFAMASAIAKYTVPNQNGWISVVPDRIRGEPRPEWIREEAKLLNEAARQFSASYDRFIRIARPRLHIEEA